MSRVTSPLHVLKARLAFPPQAWPVTDHQPFAADGSTTDIGTDFAGACSTSFGPQEVKLTITRPVPEAFLKRASTGRNGALVDT